MTRRKSKTAEPFSGKVIVKERQAALAYASSTYDIEALQNHDANQCFIVWTDASGTSRHMMCHENSAGAGIVFRRDPQIPEWTELMLGVRGYNGIVQVELIAIKEALKPAHRRSESTFRGARGIVRIFSDSQVAPRWIRESDRRQGVRRAVERVYRLARTLADVHVKVELHWVPGHRVEGNIRADKVGRRGKGCCPWDSESDFKGGPAGIFSYAGQEDSVWLRGT